jgi:competence protein ComEC
VVTHYHADHTNGLPELMARIPADTIYLPRIEDEFGVRDRLVALAKKYGTSIVYVDAPVVRPMGQASLRLYPPLGEGDLNEQGLTVLCSAGNYDALITGDMAGSTEKKLVERYALPDIELLVVSHHGSKYATSRELLEAVTPETAVISVGDNSYGHPADEALLRLIAANCEIYRTDLQGHILLTVEGEE